MFYCPYLYLFLQFPLDYLSQLDPPLENVILLTDDPFVTHHLAQQALKCLLKFNM